MMTFNYCSIHDEENANSLNRLIRSNGYFVSPKQSEFFKKQASEMCGQANAFKADTQKFICVDATVRWADYGHRSVRRVSWLYVIDDIGIVKKLKLKFVYSDDQKYSQVFWPATTVEWERNQHIPAPIWKIQETKVSSHVGVVGNRQRFSGKLTRKQFIGYNSFGESRYLTTIDCDGNLIVYWGLLGSNVCGEHRYADVGDMVEFDARIKDHTEFRGTQQTIVQRPTKISINQFS